MGPEPFLGIIRTALINAGCFVRTLQYNHSDDSGGILRVTTDDDRIYSVHFDLSENQNPG